MPTDRQLLTDIRSQLGEFDDLLIDVRMRIMPGARTGAIERARQALTIARAELGIVMIDRLDGDTPANSEPVRSPADRFLGVDLARPPLPGDDQ